MQAAQVCTNPGRRATAGDHVMYRGKVSTRVKTAAECVTLRLRLKRLVEHYVSQTLWPPWVADIRQGTPASRVPD
jgi:hypothetical protein